MGERPLKLLKADAGRALPWEAEAEVATLGACLIDSAAVAKAAEILEPEHFHREGHRILFRSMMAVTSRGIPLDPVTLGSELISRDELDAAGGMPYIAELLDVVPTSANVDYHAALVLDAARRRQLIAAGTEIVRIGYDPDGMSADVLVDRAERLVANCMSQSGEVATVKGLLWPVFERIERVAASGDGIIGVPWGLADADAMTGGLQKGDLVIVAARPSMGKTALATGVALSAAVSHGTSTAIFSLEMSAHQVVQRLLCHEALVDLQRVIRGNLADDDYGRLAQASGHLQNAPLLIDDTGGLTPQGLRGKLSRIKADNPELGLVVVDYIQLMTGSTRRGDSNRQQEVSDISRSLKTFAREFDVPIIALSQLSRGPEQRSNHRPQLSDLRESGSIEQDADVVAFLYRPEYYESDKDAQEKGIVGKTELIISKQRNGPTGTVDLYFRKECARFESFSGARAPTWGVRP